MRKSSHSSLKLVPGGPIAAQVAQIYRSARDQLIRFLVLQTGSHAEVEDIAQAAYLKLLARADELTDTNLRSLLFVTARNLALDLRRQHGRRRRVIDDFDGVGEAAYQIPSLAPGAERWLIAREHVEIIANLMNELPPKCRRAFIAYKFEELDYWQIADEMGVSQSMVRKYVIRAISHCAKRFEELEGWE